MKFLKIEPAHHQLGVTIQASLPFETNVLRNRLWYRGDPDELDQFFKATATTGVGKSKFWAAVPSLEGSIRKLHSGLPGEIVDKVKDIVVNDLETVTVNQEDAEESEDTKRWQAIAEDNKFKERLFGDAVKDTLITGDGAFKISIDTELSEYPIIEFYSGEQLEYEYKRGRLQSIKFHTEHIHEKKSYRLVETYSPGSISYKLYKGDEEKLDVPLTTVPELANLTDVKWAGDFMAAVPMRFFESSKYPGRGQSIYDRKSDAFDALDEVVSQWIDAIRAGRVKNYIPEDLIPKDPATGKLLNPNAFDNMFIARGTSMKETAEDKIDQVQAQINLAAYIESYAAKLDLSLMGIVSPSTLGIDLKKTDNALAQREKEKTTLYTRGKIQAVLYEVIPQLVQAALLMDDRKNETLTGAASHKDRYDVGIQFGEYASPDFNETVAVVGQARSMGLMSLEKAIDELYGETLTEEEKAAEIERIRAEMNVFPEPEMKPVGGLDDEEDPEMDTEMDTEEDPEMME